MTDDSQMITHSFAGERPPPSIDPTILTTEALMREISSLKELLFSRIDAMDRATDLRIDSMLKIPAETDRAVAHLAALQKEKFGAIEQQFIERDVRTEQASRASADALAAALQAAKELVGSQGEASAAAAVKSETSFTKQIDQIGTIISTQGTAQDARITELKERIDRGEGSTTGHHDQRTELRASMATLYMVIAVFVGLIGVGLAIFAATKP